MITDSDIELLELALSAVSIARNKDKPFVLEGSSWNPLRDDATAFRLAVELGIAVIPYPIYSMPKHSVIAKRYSESHRSYRDTGETDLTIEEVEIYGEDAEAATRRAIVKVAAKIGATVSPSTAQAQEQK